MPRRLLRIAAWALSGAVLALGLAWLTLWGLASSDWAGPRSWIS